MTESQPEGSEWLGMQWRKIWSRKALSRSKKRKPTNTPRERAWNHLQTSTKEEQRQAKVKQQDGEEVFLVNGESESFNLLIF